MSSLFRISTVTIYRLLSSPVSSVGSKLIIFRNKSINTTTAATAVVLSVGGNNNTKKAITSTSIVNSSSNLFDSHYQQQQQYRKFSTIIHHNLLKLLHNKTMTPSRTLSSTRLTKNLTFYTQEPLQSEINKKTLKIKNQTGNPLVLIMAWLMSKENQLRKYVQIYSDLGFDVLVITMTPWQLLWPVKGTQIIATELLKFLHSNNSIQPIVVHGFSVGGYQFSEMLVLISNDKKKYQHILDRIVCQIWDSPADILEIAYGTSKSIFPNSPLLQTALSNYISYHIKAFHNQATSHYYRARDVFQKPLLKAPVLFLVSRNDPVGLESNCKEIQKHWEKQNVRVTLHCWEKSGHVSHYFYHKNEYLSLLQNHLSECGLIEKSAKRKSKL